MAFRRSRASVVFASAVAFLIASVAAPQSTSSPEAIARTHLQSNRLSFGLSASDIAEVSLSSVVPSRSSGVAHVYLQQAHRGIEVYGALVNVSVGPDGRVLSSGNRFVSQLAAAAGGQNARKLASEAAGLALGRLGLQPTRPLEVVAQRGGAAQRTTLSDAGIASRPIEAKLVWLPTGRALRLAWQLEVEERSGEHWWQTFVDADTGADLGRLDLMVHDSVQGIAGAIARANGAGWIAPSFPATDGAAYQVFPLPFESPSDGDRQLVENAADPSASPYGWHDTDGVAGPEFTRTRGNNVHAYTDIDANNIADPGSDPDGGAGLLFDFPLDLTQNPPTYRPAAVTNLFYWNNVMHDVTHGYGFDEPSGNFQVNTYGNGGVGGDDVRAEAQDGSGTNNANFGTGVDGVRPRMQMFVWTHPLPNFVDVDSPASIAGAYGASGAVFGPTVAATGPIAGNVALVNDGAGASTSDACEPLVGFPAGAIALLDRGTCAFVIKVKNAQNAGAVAAIVVNNVAGSPITMGGADATIVIPSVMVSLDDGNLFKASLPVHATLRANPLTSVNRDSDLDAGVIAHEYGHGISNRLTGGPAIVSCLGNAEQMGEGWSDWFALALTADPADGPTTARGIGTYLTFEPPTGFGIRPTQYSTDPNVNPSTYAWVADVAAISQPHGIGYVWATMVWEVYWNLVDRHGYNADIYGDWSTGGNNLAFQLVMDGLKFQPCRPGFVDGRNAILAADVALTGGQNQCEIWRGFAKRGLGASASQGSSESRIDGVEAFDLPASCTAAAFGGFHPPIAEAPFLNGANAGSTVPVKFTLAGAGDAVAIDSQPVDCLSLEPTGEEPQPLSSPGATGLTRNGDEYHVNWQTDPAWAGTCRRVTLRIAAPSDPVAFFSFF